MDDKPSRETPPPPALDELPPAPELVSVPLTPPQGQEQFVEQPPVEPQTAATAPDAGAKMFVLFFFLIVPPLGVFLLAAVCWMLFKKFMSA